MTDRPHIDLIGVGIYTVPDAARLTGVSTQCIRRWIQGYRYPRRGEVRRQPPVWRPDLGEFDGDLCLSFRDLMEVRLVNELRKRGIAWKWIRKVGEAAARSLRTSHPFCTQEFATLGKAIILRVRREESAGAMLLDLARDQWLLQVVEPYLLDLDFEGQAPVRWWPIGKDAAIVVDPARGFGKPILSKNGIPTRVLAKCYEVEGSYEAVAGWFDVDEESVEQAVGFERTLREGRAA